mmetsp:Transcript_9846/g.22353  ORF Transcript_9846/g.22353 Transcript_9846/m.22353 type:complete len:157 (-) Transcript_9846:805-1275(-)
MELLLHQPTALVVVDSVAAPVRAHFDRGQIAARQEKLVSHAAALKYLAETHELAVLVTNQVMGSTASARLEPGSIAAVTGRDDALLSASLGNTWSHSVNMRLVLQCQPSTVPLPPSELLARGIPPELREIRVAKSPMCSDASFPYVIGAHGLDKSE